MNQLQVTVEIRFEREPDLPYSKVWKRLRGTILEQGLALPAPVLAQDNRLELVLDGESRPLCIERLSWNASRQALTVVAVPTEELARELRALGLKSRRFWVGRRARDEFLERCRRAGWRRRGAEEGAPAPVVAPAPVQRREPTL